jgi:hypothetical protein
VADSERVLDLCRTLGISAQFTIMTFHPEATLATVRDDVAFMRRHAHHALAFCRTEIYAGTPLEQRMVAEGRARGDYLARAYGFLDPSVELLCNLWLRCFAARCTDAHGILNLAIGMDYRAAVIRRFYHRPGAQALVGRIEAFCREVNSDTLDRFAALVEVCAGRADLSERLAEAAVRDIAYGEADSRSLLEPEAQALIRAIDNFATAAPGASRRSQAATAPAPRTLGFSAAAVLAAGLACSQTAVSEMPAPPLDAARNPGPDVRRDEPYLSEMAPPPLDAALDSAPDLRRDEPIMSEIDAPPLEVRHDEPVMSEIDAQPLEVHHDEPIMAEVAASPLDAAKDTTSKG